MIEDKVKRIVLDSGADICGIASIERFKDAPQGFSPKDIFSGCKSVIALGVALPKGLTRVDSRLIYAHFNNRSCVAADDISFKASRRLEKELGAISVPIPCDSPYEFWDKDTMTGKGLISMKHTAVLCGLGQLGKSSLLLNPSYGNLLTIAAILTDLDLVSDPYYENICIEGCTKCIEACPVQAIKDGQVNQKKCRCNTYGSTSRGFDTVDCNRCRTVCPMRYGIITPSQI